MEHAIPTAVNPDPKTAEKTSLILFDAAVLKRDVMAIAQAHASSHEARKAIVVALNERLVQERLHAEQVLLTTKSGLNCANYLSHVMDAIIESLYAVATQFFYPADNPSTAEYLSVAAVGGYGRGTLAPGSDIDLLFLLPYKTTPWSESVIEIILYTLWDLKLKVGHSTRTVEECVREARADMTIRTALLEARFLTGQKPLYETFETRFDKDIVIGSAAEFVEAKLAEREQRVTRAGTSRYLVEPNVKDGKGGLRDLNTLFWISKYAYRVKLPSELVQAGLFDEDELRLFERCEDFLWRVRCHMHFTTGRAEERLSFDMQRNIAERMGYKSHGGLSSVERFMKRYFLVAKDVGDLTAIVCSALQTRHTQKRPILQRMLESLKRHHAAIPDTRDFVLIGDRISVAKPDIFAKDPVNLLRLFWFADQLDRFIHPDATRLVTQSLRLVTSDLRKNEEANRLFVEILNSKKSPETLLRRMNETGLLGRFIPQFGRIVAMMQFNMYHHYTVDEHLLRSMGILATLDQGLLKDDLPVAHEILPSIRNRKVLAVAIFLHDIAKGRPEDHSIAGERVARVLCPRLGLNDNETESVAWLIEHHLDMSTIAQSRDLSDPRTIESFAAVVQTLERLKMLLVLTVCDIMAVGPGVWNGWKGQLLRTLFWETEIILAGGHSTIDRAQRVKYAQEMTRQSLPGWSDPEIDAYIGRHFPAYWLKVDQEHRTRHARFLLAAERDMHSMATEVATDKFRGITELTVTAPDHPRLLAIITGACAAAGANIVDAQIFTTTDGMALDSISVSRAFENDEDELRRAARVARSIEQALKGDIRISEVVASHHKRRSNHKAFQVLSEVVIDNALSSRTTVVEVSGLDRPGLLYELTTALGKLNLNITSAHIATFGEKVVDVFYVTDLTGSKVVHSGRIQTIEKTLMSVLESGQEIKSLAETAN